MARDEILSGKCNEWCVYYLEEVEYYFQYINCLRGEKDACDD
jgi:hypothetical protein